MINRSEWSRHLELTCKRKLVMWNFCWSTLHLSGSIKDFPSSAFWSFTCELEIIAGLAQCYVAVILRCKIDRNIVIWWFINSLKTSHLTFSARWNIWISNLFFVFLMTRNQGWEMEMWWQMTDVLWQVNYDNLNFEFILKPFCNKKRFIITEI